MVLKYIGNRQTCLKAWLIPSVVNCLYLAKILIHFCSCRAGLAYRQASVKLQSDVYTEWHFYGCSLGSFVQVLRFLPKSVMSIVIPTQWRWRWWKVPNHPQLPQASALFMRTMCLVDSNSSFTISLNMCCFHWAGMEAETSELDFI